MAEFVRVINTGARVVRIPNVVGQRGATGPALELQTTATMVQWRVAGQDPEDDWQDLVALEDLRGPEGKDGDEVALRATDTAIEWRLGETGEWTELVLLEDLRGPEGNPGAAATITVGDVTTSEPGGEASVENVGGETQAVLNFTIPRGQSGNDGAAATLEVGDTTTLAAGESATVTNEGNETHAVLRFAIPQGGKGDPGNDGLGWTEANYDPATGVVTFVSNDGLGFTTGDLRGQDGDDGIGVPDATGAPAGQVPVTDGEGGYVLGEGGTGGGGITWRSPGGEWLSDATYQEDDTVQHDGATWVATAEVGAIGGEPGAAAQTTPVGRLGGSGAAVTGAVMRIRFGVTAETSIGGVIVQVEGAASLEAMILGTTNGVSTSASYNAWAAGEDVLAETTAPVATDAAGAVTVLFSEPVVCVPGVTYMVQVYATASRIIAGTGEDLGGLTRTDPTNYTGTVSKDASVGTTSTGRHPFFTLVGTTPTEWVELVPAPPVELPDTAAASEGDVLTLSAGKEPEWGAPSGGGGSGATIETAVISVGTLASGETAVGTATLPSVFAILRVDVNTPGLLRIYASEAYRDADESRAAGSVPQGDHGLIYEASLTTDGLAGQRMPWGHIAAGDEAAWRFTGTGSASSEPEVTLTLLNVVEA